MEQASALNEAVSLTAVTFGEAGDQVLAFGEGAAESFGLSNAEALTFANNIGGLFIGLGMSQEAAAGLSQEVIGLGADLASAKNLTGGATEALERLQAGIVGEVEPLRRLGVSFNAAQVEARALADTGKSSAAALTEGEKAAARYAIILEQLGAQGVVGDFARTSDSLANQQRTLNGIWADAQAEIGANLTPAVGDFIEAIREGIPLLVEFSDSSAGSADALTSIVSALNTAGDALRSVNDTTGDLTGGIDLLETFTASLPGLGAVAGVADQWQAAFGTFEKQLVAVGNEGKGTGEDLSEAEQAIADVGQAAEDARDELDALFGTEQSVAEGAIDLRDGARDLLAQLAELGTGGYRAGSEAGDRFLSSLQDQAAGIRDQVIALAENGASYDEARAAQESYTTGLIQVARAAGVPEEAIRELVRVYGSVPPDVLTNITQRGAQDVTGRLDAMNTKARDIPSNVHVTATSEGIDVVVSGLQRLDEELRAVAASYDQADANRAAAATGRGGGPELAPTEAAPGGRGVTVNVNAGTIVGDPEVLARELAPRIAAEIDTYERSY